MKYKKIISAAAALFLAVSDVNMVMSYDYSDIIDKHIGVRNGEPGEVKTEDLPSQNLLGNGDIGVTAGGTSEKQDFIIGKNGFYTDKSEEFKSDYVDETGYAGSGVSNTNTQVVLGGISILIPQLQSGEFVQEMDMRKAESRNIINKDNMNICTRTNVNANENIIIIELANNGSEEMNVTVDLWTKPLFENKRADTSAGADNETLWITRRTEEFAGSLFTNTGAAALEIKGKHPDIQIGDNNVSGQFLINPDEKIYIVTKILTDENYSQLREEQLSEYLSGSYGDYSIPDDYERSDTPLSDAIERVQNISGSEINQLNDAHLQWWDNFWRKSWVSIPNNKELEKYWYSSLYILASAAREGKPAPGLFGPWVTTDIPHYNGDYTLNYNFEHSFYGCYAANHPELGLSFQKSIVDNVPLGRKKAEEQFGYQKGIYFGTHAGPTGLEWTLPYDYEMRSNALECSVNFIKYYLYTQDINQLKNVIYPYMKEVMDFWEQNLVKESGGITYQITEPNADGWTVRKGGGPHVLWAGDGYMNGKFTDYSPMINSPQDLNIDTSEAKYIRLRMKINRSGETSGIFFATDSSNSITADKKVEYKINSNDFEEYEIDMSANEKWTGQLKSLRLDPVRSGPVADGEYNIDYIQILDSDKNIIKEWNFDDCDPELNKYQYIKLSLKNNSEYNKAQISFNTIFDEEFKTEQSVQFDISSNDSEYNEYIIDMSGISEWDNTINKLKFEILGDSGTYNINEIQIVDSDLNIKKELDIDSEKNYTIGHRYSIISSVDERKEQNYNAASAIAYLKHLSKYIIEFSELLNADEDRRTLWEDIYTHLPDYPVTTYNGMQVFAFDEGMMNPEGNVFPFNSYLFYPTNNEGINSKYAQIGINSLNVNNAAYFTQRNSFTQVYAAAARMGYPFEDIISKMSSVLKSNTGPSNIHLMASHKTIENASATENINSLLLQSNEGFIRIFPAASALKDAEFKDLRTEGAFLVSSKLKESQILSLEIKSEAGGECRLLSPCQDRDIFVKDSKGEIIEYSTNDSIISFNTVKGETYKIVGITDMADVYDPYFTDESGAKIETLVNGNINFNITIENNTLENQNCALVLAEYKDDKLIDISVSENFIIESGNKKSIVNSIKSSGETNDCYIKAFLFENLESIKPLTPCYILK